jgi:hypothetical protein
MQDVSNNTSNKMEFIPHTALVDAGQVPEIHPGEVVVVVQCATERERERERERESQHSVVPKKETTHIVLTQCPR